MARPARAGADPGIPPKEAPTRAPEESIEAAQPQRLQRVRANLRLPGRPFVAPSADYNAGLRALRLLDFVRLDLPSSSVPRPDLVAELIANYSSSRGWSSVRGKQIEVSLQSFARALSLPPYGSTPASSVTDTSAVTSAVREFTKVYIGAPAEASTDMKRKLPSTFFVKNVKRGPEYTTELVWELVKQEMEHLAESESTDWVRYYGAFLHRLIWVEIPELFQPPPELSVSVAPAALSVAKEQGNNPATIHENQKRCSESPDIGISGRREASSKQIDMASKKFDSASNINIASPKMIETTSKQLDARTKKLSEKDGDVQAVESLDQALVTKERETNDMDRSQASSKQIDMASKKNDSASKKRKQGRSHKTERRSARLASKKVDLASRLCLSNIELEL